ncbi:short chain dehydrogenase family protein [Bordetella holmesii 30539]|uniref:Short chain dehydrogenase family protein n=1 Tax=Bordetella holmesii 1058 TaxID=1247648 RepID=A0ABP3BMN9_9BORD|nr:short chain dehydrogenase family protein [Bordetella holmesii ATCC 51541]AIT26607.1 short chain dehydrogenase family protein [Bordetella holmesii 44057]EWM42084.1 short chain dehydrogenase family protein [Bordetella holmesii 41130]EWM47190.1 short chain dehydrogenase family protein [Bordetella holmesii 35009]EXF88605.1 short chain dehydrogenase family protein [Bordetella holmesii 30539]EXX96428.1 short chain dehydrogenase family protein [Bordetella holmesii 1058]
MLGRDEQALQAARASLAGEGIEAGVVAADITQADAVAVAFEQARAAHGPIQILVNNAGQAVSERFERTSAQLWEQMLQVNLSGTFHCTQAALPDMLQGGWGRVINVASTAGLIGYGYVTAYCAAKHGVVGLTRALAQEVARKGITVNAVCPGYTETDIVRQAVDNIMKKTGMDETAARARLAERNPQGRLVSAAEVADTVAWLALPASASVNGQAIAVDGGEAAA